MSLDLSMDKVLARRAELRNACHRQPKWRPPK